MWVEGKKRTIQVPDPERAKYRIAMFDHRIQGLGDAESVEKINAMGYRSPSYSKWNRDHTAEVGVGGGKPLTIKQLQRDIANPIYAGFECGKWTHYKPVKTPYDGLVSVQKFNQANRGKVMIMENDEGLYDLVRGNPAVLASKARDRYNPDYAYKFIRCPSCGEKMLGSASTGKGGVPRPAYHCTRGHKRVGVKKNVMVQ